MDYLRWGCVADDFTGASDVCSFLVNKGVRTLLICGEPREDYVVQDGVQAVVIALKSRTAPASEAVEQTLRMFDWLKAQKCEKLYFKYCSTFDSTETGNIGPVIDALLEKLGIPFTILCPALLVNGRTVKDGQLYVNDVLLEHSGMRNHPLTPMRHSSLMTLIERQGKYKCLVLTHEDYQQGAEYIQHKIQSFAQSAPRFYISVDFFKPEHGQLIMECFGDLPVLTGGSGLMECIADTYWTLNEADVNNHSRRKNMPKGLRRLILVGSCSDMTKAQIRKYKDNGGVSIEVSPRDVEEGKRTSESVWNEAQAFQSGDVLIYSAGARDDSQGQENLLYGGEDAAKLLENLMGDLAEMAIAYGYENIIVAGGETSGAVVKRLSCREFYVAESVDPGVPVLIPMDADQIKIVLKSGNFGREDFFIRALRDAEEV